MVLVLVLMMEPPFPAVSACYFAVPLPVQERYS
jgi:hypothetical protein